MHAHSAIPLSNRRVIHCLLLSVMAFASAPALALCSARSGIQTTAVIELYTSEGCDSCPPADRWLSRLPAQGFTADQVVPLAFHVDYWDDLGWRDRFANAAYSDRQREQVRRQRARLVYTPQVFLDGRDFRVWNNAARLRKEIGRIRARPAPVQLSLSAGPAHAGSLPIDLRAAALTRADTQALSVYVAVTENGLTSRVTAGENKNRELHHDYVVRVLLGPLALESDRPLSLQRSITLPADIDLGQARLVAFTQSDRTSGIQQALALPLARCSDEKLK